MKQPVDVRKFQRARHPEQKEDRRQAILETAQEQLAASSFSELTMARLAQKAGLAKGTLYLYFETKEELLLALVEDLLGRWFGEIRQELRKVKSKPEAIARTTAASLLKQDALSHLLPIMMSVSEQNASRQWVVDYRARVLGQCRVAGRLIESCTQGMRPGGGFRFLLCAFALMAGLRQLGTDRLQNRRLTVAPPGLKGERTPFAREFTASLEVLMRGLGGA